MSKHLISISDIKQSELIHLIDKAIEQKSQPAGKVLANKNIGLLFSRPSTRTRTSFSLAASNLGASVIHYNQDDMQLITGESINDTAGVLAEYLDILIMRCHSNAEITPFIDLPSNNNAELSVVNALTEEEHPSQALADLMTIKEHFGRFDNIKVLFIGDGGNIATSFLLAGAQIPGLELHFISPKAYGFQEKKLEQAYALSKCHQAQIYYYHDPHQLPKAVDVVYTTRWRSMGCEKTEPDWLKHFDGFQVDRPLLNKIAGPETVIMHDLPAERGMEISSDVLDSSNSIIFQQARNKMETAKVILPWCLNV